jgi:hypothetical protein
MEDDPQHADDGNANAKSWEEEIVDDHALVVGHAILEWSRLHEELGTIFAYLVSPHNERSGSSVWHSITSDLQQRKSLKAALAAVREPKDAMRLEIEWVLDSIQKIHDDRNSAVHVAFALGIADFDTDSSTIEMQPMAHTGNPRAQKLKDRNTRVAFEDVRRIATELRFYAKEIAQRLRPIAPTKEPLPQRPDVSRSPQS